MRKSVFYLYALLLALSLVACNGKKTQCPVGDKDSTAVVDTTAADEVADTTIYGTSTEDFGMSTFSMVTDKGDTLNVARTSDDGTYAQIYGSIDYGQRYAMITTDNGEAMSLLVNLTELDKRLKNYDIVNGHLIVDGDTVAWEKYFQNK